MSRIIKIHGREVSRVESERIDASASRSAPLIICEVETPCEPVINYINII